MGGVPELVGSWSGPGGVSPIRPDMGTGGRKTGWSGEVTVLPARTRVPEGEGPVGAVVGRPAERPSCAGWVPALRPLREGRTPAPAAVPGPPAPPSARRASPPSGGAELHLQTRSRHSHRSTPALMSTAAASRRRRCRRRAPPRPVSGPLGAEVAVAPARGNRRRFTQRRIF